MLVEDDNNLREIYEARLKAEGYEIVSAKDGEEALALAVKARPDLIITDIMMPKIGGFDMLDILRSIPEAKNSKIIVMTALSQSEDKSRADKLGADRYLVKSQVTLEDVVKVTREVLQAEPGQPGSQVAAAAAAENLVYSNAPTPVIVAPPVNTPQNIPDPTPATPPTDNQQTINNATSLSQSTKDESTIVDQQLSDFNNSPVFTSAPSSNDNTQSDNQQALDGAVNAINQQSTTQDNNNPTPASTTDSTNQYVNDDSSNDNGQKTALHNKVINPINDLSAKPDLNALLAKEEAQEQARNTIIETKTVQTNTQPIIAEQNKNTESTPQVDPSSIAL